MDNAYERKVHGSYRPETFLFKNFSRTNHIFSTTCFLLNLKYMKINPSIQLKKFFVHEVPQTNFKL